MYDVTDIIMSNLVFSGPGGRTDGNTTNGWSVPAATSPPPRPARPPADLAAQLARSCPEPPVALVTPHNWGHPAHLTQVWNWKIMFCLRHFLFSQIKPNGVLRGAAGGVGGDCGGVQVRV